MPAFVAVGSKGSANGVTAATPGMPAGYAIGDLLLCISLFRTTAGTFASTWATALTGSTGNFHHLISYKLAASTSETAPTITPSGGTTIQPHAHRVLAFRDIDPITPFGPAGAFSQNSNLEDIGPLSAPTVTGSSGVVLAIGARLDATATAIAALTGDSLTWAELFEDTTTTTNSIQTVADYALWAGGPPTLTSKTFDVTTGTQQGAGRIFTLNGPLGSPIRKRLGGVPYARLGQPGVW